MSDNDEDDVSNIFNHPAPSQINDENNRSTNGPQETEHSELFGRDELGFDQDRAKSDQHMEDPDHPMDSLIEELQNDFHLNDHFGTLASKAVKSPPEEHYARSIYLVSSIAQHFATEPKTTGTTTQDPFKDFIRDTARRFIVKTDIEAYTATVDKHSNIIAKSLPKLTRDAADQKPEEYKAKFYPEGHDGNNATGKSPYRQALSSLVKYVRQQLRDSMLENQKIQPSAPVPDIDTLIKAMIQELLPKSEKGQQVHTNITWKQRIRFSHLRLETASNYLNHHPKGVTQWTMIDQRLEDLRWKSTAFRQKHAQLVIAKDKELFGQGKLYKDIVKARILMPTMQEVQDAMQLPEPSAPSPVAT
ncbi:hypothetical protein PtA15_1A513 [Puccinia triticina]|uniref:Ubinuclein middle domain-containing protein n=1 Tax=Puccinia triticina TaxID=208348 RepID=A0ABY7C907_9BASI|nr:uncharacterized protein PtA15_1A513 [Puccinia triticina]WAQ81174.1 hypothetical protein PtA15_1A513 [Puccinia triticina]WAR52070.1 hypothetical protein PtB15_1B509 [Puccinia triticina]